MLNKDRKLKFTCMTLTFNLKIQKFLSKAQSFCSGIAWKLKCFIQAAQRTDTLRDGRKTLHLAYQTNLCLHRIFEIIGEIILIITFIMQKIHQFLSFIEFTLELQIVKTQNIYTCRLASSGPPTFSFPLSRLTQNYMALDEFCVF